MTRPGDGPSWRRRGLASAMIGKALIACRAAGHHRADLYVGGENREAVRLYTASDSPTPAEDTPSSPAGFPLTAE